MIYAVNTTATDVHMPVSQLEIGMRFRSLGPGYMTRKVSSVELRCSCFRNHRLNADCRTVVRFVADDGMVTTVPLAWPDGKPGMVWVAMGDD